MAGEGCVIDFDVHLEVLVQSVCAEEADDGFGIDVVLMLGGLHGLGLNEEGSLESLAAGIVAGGFQHVCKMVFLPLHLSVEK